MREAPSRIVIADLLQRGAEVVAHDPVAMDEARRIFGDTAGLSYAEAPMDAVEGADALVVVTEWKAFRSPDFERIRKTLKQPVIFDGRNLFDPARLREAGIEYFPIGRRS
jgi:UDPglucose 6-dehydrogenase